MILGCLGTPRAHSESHVLFSLSHHDLLIVGGQNGNPVLSSCFFRCDRKLISRNESKVFQREWNTFVEVGMFLVRQMARMGTRTT
jgi:hypothetical protein